MKALTVEAIERAYEHEPHGRVTEANGSSYAECPGWLGFGYLGERRLAVEPSDDAEYEAGRRVAAIAVPIVDQAIVDRANALGWSEERLFEWLNSRDARHFADAALWSESPMVTVEKMVPLWLR